MIVLDCIQGSPEWQRARLGVVTASDASRLLNGGGEPRMPTYYARNRDRLAPSARAKRQLAIWEWLGDGPQPIDASGARKAMVDDGLIFEVPPPKGAEPIRPPITLSAQRDDYMNRLLAEWVTGQPAEDFAGNYWTERGHEYEDEARSAFAWETGCTAKSVGFVYRDEGRRCGCSPDWFNADERWGLELKCPAAHTHIGYLRQGGVPLEYEPQIQFSLWVTGVERWYFLSYHPSLPPVLTEVKPEPRWQNAFDEHVPTFLAEMQVARELLLSMDVRPAMGVAA